MKQNKILEKEIITVLERLELNDYADLDEEIIKNIQNKYQDILNNLEIEVTSWDKSEEYFNNLFIEILILINNDIVIKDILRLYGDKINLPDDEILELNQTTEEIYYSDCSSTFKLKDCKEQNISDLGQFISSQIRNSNHRISILKNLTNIILTSILYKIHVNKYINYLNELNGDIVLNDLLLTPQKEYYKKLINDVLNTSDDEFDIFEVILPKGYLNKIK